jgi:4-hydroxybenzoate polyprenyltransferase
MTAPVDVRDRLVTEVRILYRLNAHNVWVCVLPVPLFAGASWVSTASENRKPMLWLIAVAWAYLYVYINDAGNQVTGVEEDRVNKPHRPIPAGLIDSRGLWKRFLIACVLYLAVASVASWAALLVSAAWVGTNFVANRMPQRYYFLWKPVFNWVGAACQLAGSWCIFSPLNRTAVTWVLIIVTMATIGMPIEDVRDIQGDRAIGRRSLASMLGGRVVSRGFSLLMIVWPVLAVYLILPRGISSPAEAVSVAVLAILCTCAVTLASRSDSERAQGAVFIVYSFIHVALTALPLVYLLSQRTSI